MGTPITSKSFMTAEVTTAISQTGLPKMPVPSLSDSVEQYLSVVLPLIPADMRKETSDRATEFLNGTGPLLYKELLEYDSQQVNYLDEFYREIYTGATDSNYFSNPTLLLCGKPGMENGPKRAAHLTAASLQYHSAIQSGTLAPHMFGKRELCMRQASQLFASARIAGRGAVDDVLCCASSSRHIVVINQGVFFKLPVIDESGVICADVDLLEQRFIEIGACAPQHTSSSHPSLSAVGSLTTGARCTWNSQRQELLKLDHGNMESLKTIDEALFIVALDSVSGLTIEELERNVLYGLPETVYNRWLDKWNLIICEDGQAGLNWEHSMLDGHTMMEFLAEIDCGFDASAAVVVNQDCCRPYPIMFKVDQAIQACIASCEQSSLNLAAAVGISVLEYKGFGKTFMKNCKCSPDAFLQTIMTLAFFKLKGRLAVPYESVLCKYFKHGRVTVARNMSAQIADSVLAIGTSSSTQDRCDRFRQIAANISKLTSDAAKANSFDRLFLGLRKIAKGKGMDVNICEGDAWASFNALDLCSSNCGRHPIRLFGFSPPPDSEQFAIGYFMVDESVQFSINHLCIDESLAMKRTILEELDLWKNLFGDSAAVDEAPHSGRGCAACCIW